VEADPLGRYIPQAVVEDLDVLFGQAPVLGGIAAGTAGQDLDQPGSRNPASMMARYSSRRASATATK